MLNQYNNQNTRGGCSCGGNTRSASGCGCGGNTRAANSACGARTWQRRNFESSCSKNTRSTSGCGCGGNTRTANSACGARTWERRNFNSCGGNTRSASGCGCSAGFAGGDTVWKNRENGCSCGASRSAERSVCDQGASDSGILEGQSLAMVYSPYQRYEDLYGAKEGLCNGTIFCRLDKPFCGDGRR